MNPEEEKREFKCDKCFDTGCRCGGIGMSCHGCCDCEAGDAARENRKKGLRMVVDLAKLLRGEKKKDVRPQDEASGS